MAVMASSMRHVGLFLENTQGYTFSMMRGIVDFAQRRWDWIVEGCDIPDAVQPKLLAGFRGDGVIATLSSPAMVRAARKLRCPVVNVSGAAPVAWPNSVLGDDRAIGRLGAEHLVDLGLRRLMFVWAANVAFSAERRDGFVQAAAERGLQVQTIDLRRQFGYARPRLPLHGEPAGMMVYDDMHAHEMIMFAQQHHISVPDDLAVLGAGNHVMRCELTRPTLSSVEGDLPRRGHEAAALLLRLMNGGPSLRRPMLVPPRGVVVRQSTNAFTLDDPQVVRAMRFIRDHLAGPIVVEDIANATDVSRRTLELRFKSVRGRTIQQEIWRQRVTQARHLLRRDSRSMLQIALDCGFISAGAFSTVFKRETGLTPRQYRGGPSSHD